MRRSGFPASIRRRRPGDLASQVRIISVRVPPGAIALTRMPSGPWVTAADSVRLLTARFIAP